MAGKKEIALAIIEILTTYTDEDHILTAKQLLDLLEHKHEIKIERRTLYANMDMIEGYGYQISRPDDNGKGYFLEEHQFDKGEFLLLCNAIHASHFISEKQSSILIKKLLKTQSKYIADEFVDRVYLPNEQKTPNVELMYNISLISDAIKEGKVIQFVYTRYNRDKQLVPRREKLYKTEPRHIVYSDGKPYMISTSIFYKEIVVYRIDRITQAVMLDEPSSAFNNSDDAYEFVKNKLFMYHDKEELVTFKCDEVVIDQMIDIFGTDVTLLPMEDGHYRITVSTSKTGARYLAESFIEYLEILEPESLRKEMAEILKNAAEKYK